MGQKTQNLMLILNPLKKLRKTQTTKVFQRKSDRKMEFFTFITLVRRCNGTTAGLGYLEVLWNVLEKVLHGQ
jgi:hypothetical protein